MRKLKVLCILLVSVYIISGCKEESSIKEEPTIQKEYTITVKSNDELSGTVWGGGDYKENDTAVFSASPNSGYEFEKWNDGITEQKREIKVTCNATYIAYFTAVNTPTQEVVEQPKEKDSICFYVSEYPIYFTYIKGQTSSITLPDVFTINNKCIYCVVKNSKGESVIGATKQVTPDLASYVAVYELESWNTKPDGSGQGYEKGATVQYGQGINNTYYAIFKVEYCTVTYDTKFGITPENLKIEKNSKLTSEQLPQLSSTGHVFIGWYDGNKKVDAGYVITQNSILTAKWGSDIETPIDYEHFEPDSKKYIGKHFRTKLISNKYICDFYIVSENNIKFKLLNSDLENITSTYDVKKVSNWNYEWMLDENNIDGVNIIFYHCCLLKTVKILLKI